MRHVDALVIGGGPAGASTALCLARRGWSVLVVEKKAFPRRKVCGEYLSASNLPLWEDLGLAELFHQSAGPYVHRVGLFTGETVLHAPLPSLGANGWGRALSREKLDTFLLEQVADAGAEVLQPATAKRLERTSEQFVCEIETDAGETVRVRTRIVVAAHGSWEKGSLPTQTNRDRPRDSDLLGFKAHFHESALPEDLMPLFAFPGGYGGMVSCEDDRVSLSCCIRRDVLTAIRKGSTEPGEEVLAHIRRHCRGFREVLQGASRQGTWLGAGPIRPGIRLRPTDEIFLVGNAAGEAHPVVAEGISMALQGGWLLAKSLLTERKSQNAMRRYHRQWRDAFTSRIYASMVVAHWAMRPLAVRILTPILRCFPSLLSWGAKLSGKIQRPV